MVIESQKEGSVPRSGPAGKGRPDPCCWKQGYRSMRGGGFKTVLRGWVTKLDQAGYSQNTIHTTCNDMMEEPC